MTIICDIKIDVNMCEPHYANFFEYLIHGPGVYLFDMTFFDNFWHFYTYI